MSKNKAVQVKRKILGNMWKIMVVTINPGINGRKAIRYINIPRDFHEYQDQDAKHRDILHIPSKPPTYFLKCCLVFILPCFLTF